MLMDATSSMCGEVELEYWCTFFGVENLEGQRDPHTMSGSGENESSGANFGTENVRVPR